MTVERIISGGQTGVDRGALYGALDAVAAGAPVTVGGWAPGGWLAEDGTIPADLRVHMRQAPSSDYVERSRANVAEADLTLVLYRRDYATGTAKTIKLAAMARKPLVMVNLATGNIYVNANTHVKKSFIFFERELKGEVSATLRALGEAKTVNVAGPRESHSAGLQAEVRFFVKLLVLAAYPYWHLEG
jgi:hypothetical protein